jgi:hypothetical protein
MLIQESSVVFVISTAFVSLRIVNLLTAVLANLSVVSKDEITDCEAADCSTE